MESSLKSVFIATRSYKKQLVIPHAKVPVLQAFLKSTIHCDVSIVNTNLGLDIYYMSDNACGTLIKNAFLLLNSKDKLTEKHFRFTICDTTEQIAEFTKISMKRLGYMPLIFNSYSRSMLHQFNQNFESSQRVITPLFLLWQQVLTELCSTEEHTQQVKGFKDSLQQAFIDHQYNPVFRTLIKESIDQLRCN